MNEFSSGDTMLSDDGEILSIDKHINWTSFDVIKKVRSILNIRKVGHAGTLDPKATGLLIVCTGKKTKQIDQFVDLEKEYIGTCQLGIRTPSFDMETEVCESKDPSGVTEKQIYEAADFFCGTQFQLPPMYSAVKYGGKPLYRYARSGKTVERTEREICITKFEIREITHSTIRFCIICSKGTYIRSLIDEFGLHLGCGAVLTSLRRTRIGTFTVSDALTIEQLMEWRSRSFNQEQSTHAICSAH